MLARNKCMSYAYDQMLQHGNILFHVNMNVISMHMIINYWLLEYIYLFYYSINLIL